MSSIQTLVSTIMFEQLTEEARTKLLKIVKAALESEEVVDLFADAFVKALGG